MFYDLVDVLFPQAETHEHIITVCPALVRTKCAILGFQKIRAISSGKILEFARKPFQMMEL